MRAKIIRFKGPYAICMREDSRIVGIKRINMPIEAEEEDILNIKHFPITIEKKITKKKYIHIDDIIIDQW